MVYNQQIWLMDFSRCVFILMHSVICTIIVSDLVLLQQL